MSEYTKGPWYWASLRDGNLNHFLMSPNAECPNDTVGPVIMDAGLYGPRETDAHLIAAAPDLLEALRKMVQYVPMDVVYCRGDKCREPWCGSCFLEEDAEEAVRKACAELNEARAAIAKAKGESQ